MRSSLAALTRVVIAVSVIIFGCPFLAFSQGTGQGETGIIAYKPPMRGAPAGGGRIAAAVRGAEGDTPTVIALAPDHVGLTSQSQPVLYWFISKPTSSRIEFTLNDERGGKTLINATLPSPKQAGIQVVKLSDLNGQLIPGMAYTWFVTLEANPGQPAKDVYSGGSIMFQETPPDFKKNAASAGMKAPAFYASEGFWYDALSAAWKSGKAEEEKQNRQQGLALLKQVGFGAEGPGKSKSAIDEETEVLSFLSK